MKKSEPDKTRDLVARAILERGPATAVELAARLSITPAGIRRHLDGLVAEGILESREAHVTSSNMRGRGRPSKVFVMTDGGREKFEHSYDDLAVSALKFMASKNGAHLVSEFAQLRAEEIERKALKKVASKESINSRVEALTEHLCSEGYSATSNARGSGLEICQHHCPVAHVAAEFPELCEAETEVISRMLGTHVQRLATIANGDGVCTTFIPNNASVLKKSGLLKTTRGA
ncbi:MAG: metalloregulator ArsR/SmtB family transcription factor [Actinomycetes bacterium]